MCSLCIELAKEKLTPKEIARAYLEMTNDIDDNHWIEIIAEIIKYSNSEEVGKELSELYKIID